VSRLVGALVALVLVWGAAGCTTSRPSPEDWRTSARESLEEAASTLATVRLTVRAQEDARVWRAYAETVLADAEQAVSTAADSVATLQRPREVEAAEAAEVLDLLEQAEDLVRTVRQRVLARSRIPDSVFERLDATTTSLTTRAERL